MEKHRKGSMAVALIGTAGKLVAHALSLKVDKAVRDAHIISGLLLAARGEPAPFPDQRPPGLETA